MSSASPKSLIESYSLMHTRDKGYFLDTYGFCGLN